jgi:hypothetical protein
MGKTRSLKTKKLFPLQYERVCGCLIIFLFTFFSFFIILPLPSSRQHLRGSINMFYCMWFGRLTIYKLWTIVKTSDQLHKALTPSHKYMNEPPQQTSTINKPFFFFFFLHRSNAKKNKKWINKQHQAWNEFSQYI